MRCGLYGKLPTKRDFIAEGVPRGFLPGFEPWLQGAVGTSRMSLGSSWTDIYLKAPIWRFWLGSSHCGQTVMGAFMPSIDGVGRFFPLVIMAMANEGSYIAPPTIDPQTDWFDLIEGFLLRTLDDHLDFAGMIAELATLSPPRSQPVAPKDGSLLVRADGTVIVPSSGADLSVALETLRMSEIAALMANGTFWWTIGGTDLGAIAVTSHGLPDANLFASFLTGRFEAG